MKKEELEAGKFYWVVAEWGEVEVAKYDEGILFHMCGSDRFYPVKRVICECVMPEVKL